VLAGLYRITRPCFHPVGIIDRPFVGMHIRLGDFPSIPEAEAHVAVNYRLPIEWYIGCLLEIRHALEVQLEAIVFSDGSDAELSPILSVSNVSRSPFRAAITDMLALSASSVIITSRSTFSLWGSYLGQVPAIWYPRKSDVCGAGVIARQESRDLEVEWMPGHSLPKGFIDGVRDRIQWGRRGLDTREDH